ncbi:right-handed parallel beta-helix repeat-containing protein [Pelagibacterium sediminicola]|uniref:right-handed parallel beta-helix repeat-containing protein n=1 Tax=Pelagibacterium sediminicola TaxID=2248761 RepID=UPI0013004804|nr:right-handed parallel beta-helix repeat-containing protein [Pelagibacterium sediminicola]
MAETAQEIVERELREFKRYTGDGLPGEPVNAPLPVGDPQSGVHNPKKVNLRKAMLAPLEEAAQSASDAKDEADRAEGEADRAESEADRAENAASSFIEVATNFKTVAALQADETMGYAGSGKDVIVGEGDIITAQGFRYEVAASDATDAHVETAGGVKLCVLASGSLEFHLAAFGLDGLTPSEKTARFQKALDAAEGGTLHVGPGEYEQTEAFEIGSNTTLILAPEATVMRSAAYNNMIRNKSDGVAGGYEAAQDIHIIGGVWDGNMDNYPTAATIIAFGHCRNVSVQGAKILNVPGRWHAIELNAVKRGRVLDCYMDGGGNDDILGEAVQIDAMIDDEPFPWFGPYDETVCNGILIEDCTITNWATGIGTHSAVSGTARHENIKIFNNSISFSRVGVSMYGWAGVHIKDNRIIGSTGALDDDVLQVGIRSLPVGGKNQSDYKIVGNTLLNINRSASSSTAIGARAVSLSGVEESELLANVWIHDNFIYDIGRHGIALDFSNRAHVYDNNIVMGAAGSRAIYLYGGKDAKVHDNDCIGGGGINPLISVVTSGAFVATRNNVVNNRVSGVIQVGGENAIVTGNNCAALTTGGLVTGVISPNIVAGVAV